MHIESETHLEDLLSEPTPGLGESLAGHGGDVVVLGAGGKMGPTLARMARRALDLAGRDARVYAVSRFSDAAAAEALQAVGVELRRADLREPGAWRELPDAAAVVYMVGMKFGTDDRPGRTWTANTWVPGLCAERYRGVPTVAFSTGNVYPLMPAEGPGADEGTPPGPQGEYAWSALARERIFEDAADRHATPVCLFRLNYAVELRYGVLVDLAQRIAASRPIDLRMGAVNLVWQREANAAALLALTRAGVPAVPLNFTGRRVLPVRELARGLGRRLGREPLLRNAERPLALLSDASRAWEELGLEEPPLEPVLEATARWIQEGRPTWSKPTHYEVSDGAY